MSTYKGNNGVVKVDANSVAEIRRIEVNEQTDTLEDTVMGDVWKSFLAGHKEWDGTVEGFQDPTDANGQVALANGATVAVHFLHQGEGAGNIDVNGSAIVSNLRTSQGHDGLVEFSCSLKGVGALAKDTL